MNSLPEILSWSDVTFLPVVSAYVKKIGLPVIRDLVARSSFEASSWTQVLRK